MEKCANAVDPYLSPVKMSSQSILLFLRYSLTPCRRHFEEIIILQEFLEHQEAANGSGSQEDPYLSPSKEFKLIP
jgi:hypothetical protein